VAAGSAPRYSTAKRTSSRAGGVIANYSRAVAWRASAPDGSEGGVAGRGDTAGPMVSVGGAIGPAVAVGANDAVTAGVAGNVGTGEDN
jgi:hypothetical protein